MVLPFCFSAILAPVYYLFIKVAILSILTLATLHPRISSYVNRISLTIATFKYFIKLIYLSNIEKKALQVKEHKSMDIGVEHVGQ